MTTEAPTLERTILKKDDQAIQTGRQFAQRAKALLNAAYRAWQNLNVGDISLDQLFMLATSSPDKLEKEIRTRLYQSSDAIKALGFDEQAAMAMIKLPAAYGAVESAFSNVLSTLRSLHYSAFQPFIPFLYSIQSGNVILDEEALERELQAQYVVVATEQQTAIFSKLTQLTEILNELATQYPHMNIPVVAMGNCVIRRSAPADGFLYFFDPMMVQYFR